MTLALVAGCSAPPVAHPRVDAPPMGWNSWDSGVVPSAQVVEQVVDAMVASGMRDAGYRYVNLDAGWAAPHRDSGGHLRADPSRFPDGIVSVADYAHRHGMRLGLYASPFDEGCSAQPELASAGHEDTDARDFAAWGVDFLKYDWCRADSDHDTQVAVFARMRAALRATGRPIVYSINPNSSDDADAGGRYDWSTVADTARTGTDLVPVWRETMAPVGPLDPFVSGVFVGVADAFTRALHTTRPAGHGFWPDPDMLVTGVGWDRFVTAHFPSIRAQFTTGTVTPDQQGALDDVAALSDGALAQRLSVQPGLDDAEECAHLSLWAMLSAPLLVGTDVRTMSPGIRDILTNRDVIAVDQDPDGAPPASAAGDDRVLVKPLAGGAAAVALMNLGDTALTLTTTVQAAGMPAAQCYTVRDLWTHTDATSTGVLGGAAVPPHAVTLLRVAPTCG